MTTVNNLDGLYSIIIKSYNNPLERQQIINENLTLLEDFYREILNDNIKYILDTKVLAIIQFITESGIKNKITTNTHYKQKEENLLEKILNDLSENFFKFQPDTARELIQRVTRITIASFKEGINNKTAIELYFNKILAIKKFIGENIAEDELIKQLKNGQIRFINGIYVLFKYVSLDILFEMFDNNLDNILTFLTNIDYFEIREKHELAEELFNKLIEKDFYSFLIEQMAKEKRSQFIERYLNDYRYKKIIIGAMKSKINELSSNAIVYLLTANKPSQMDADEQRDYEISKAQFVFQCCYLVRNSNKKEFNIKLIRKALSKNYHLNTSILFAKRIEIKRTDSLSEKAKKAKERYLIGENIDINTAVELLGECLTNKIELSKYAIQGIVRSIADYILNTLGLESGRIYYYRYQNELEKKEVGSYNLEDDAINLNYKLVEQLADSKLPIYKRLEILIIMFHEIKHYLNSHMRKNNIVSMDIYEILKEVIITNYDDNFYPKNYKNYKDEITARISGNFSLLKFIEIFLPEHLTDIQDEIITTLENEKRLSSEQERDQTMYFLENQKLNIQFGFDILVRYNPEILKKYPILNLEYYPNGTPKKYEDIWLARTEENKDLIDGILRKRYPSSEASELKSSRGK